MTLRSAKTWLQTLIGCLCILMAVFSCADLNQASMDEWMMPVWVRWLVWISIYAAAVFAGVALSIIVEIMYRLLQHSMSITRLLMRLRKVLTGALLYECVAVSAFFTGTKLMDLAFFLLVIVSAGLLVTAVVFISSCLKIERNDSIASRHAEDRLAMGNARPAMD